MVRLPHYLARLPHYVGTSQIGMLIAMPAPDRRPEGPLDSPSPGPDEPLDALLARTLRTLRHAWSTTGPDLAPHQGRALRIVEESGPLRPSELAGRLHVAPRSATEVIDALEERALIVRSPDPNDRRAVLVEVSHDGRRVAEEFAAARRAQAEAFFGRLSTADRASLDRILRTLLEPPPPVG